MCNNKAAGSRPSPGRHLLFPPRFNSTFAEPLALRVVPNRPNKSRSPGVILPWQATPSPHQRLKPRERRIPGCFALVDPMADCSRLQHNPALNDGAAIPARAARTDDRVIETSIPRASMHSPGAAFIPASCWRSASPGFSMDSK